MDSIPSLTATISENGYLLMLPGRNMAEIFLKKKRRKSWEQPKQPTEES